MTGTVGLAGAPYVVDGDGARLTVRVTPRAKRSGLAGIVVDGDGNAVLAVRLSAAPVEGAANMALVRLLAATFGVARSSVRIVSGEKSRRKIVHISNLAPEALARRLAAALAP